MVSTRRRMRSGSSRFLGALIAALLFLFYAAATGGVGQDPTSNTNIILLAAGVLVCGGIGAWLFPWIQNRFSAHQMRRKALREAEASASRSRRGGSGSSRSKSRSKRPDSASK